MNLNSNHHRGWRIVYIFGLIGFVALLLHINYASGFVMDKDIKTILGIIVLAIGREVVPRFVGKGDE